jgi:hypothetical protein
VTAIWVKDLANVYDAEEVASQLGYSDASSDKYWRLGGPSLWISRRSGISDEYRVLARFEEEYHGQTGAYLTVTFEYASLRMTSVPSGFDIGRGMRSPLEDINSKFYRHTGILDLTKRDYLVKAISGDCPFIF